jgi:tetratricopeptide (TPR) repeat protein
LPIGCGKSVLASFLVAEIGKTHPVAHFFCRNDEERKRKPAYIVATIIHQLLDHPGLVQFQDQVFDLTASVYNSWPDMSTISIDRLCALLQRVIALLPSLVLLIDALDECTPEGSSREFLQGRLAFFAREYTNVRILIVSRHEEPFIETLEGRCHVIGIDRTDVTDDIRAVVTKSVSENTKLRKLEHRITAALLGGADGMFLWAELMLHTLKTARNSKAVERMLDDLPAGLDGVYCQILTNIGKTLTEEELLLRREIFGWITTATRPMTLNELSTALAIEAGNTRLDEGNVPLDLRTDIRKLCGPLVQIFDRDVVQIVHISVKEMLWKPRKSSDDSSPSYIMYYQPEVEHSHVAFVCLTYLSFEVLQTKDAIGGLVDGDEHGHSLASDNQFLEYATLNWVYHITSSGGEGAKLLQLVAKFLQSLNCFAWLELFTTFISMERENFAHHFQLRSKLLEWFSSISPPDGEELKETLTQYLVNAVLGGLTTSEQLFGIEDLRTLKVAQRLGCLYDHEDRIEDGAAAHEKVISSCSHIKDPQTLETVRKSCIELAWLHFVKENYPKSISLLEQALGGSNRSDWIHDDQGAEAMADLANVYRQQNQLELAQELMEDAVRGLEHFRGPRHVLTIRYTVELCRIYFLQKDYEKAQILLKPVLKVADDCLGNEHPRTLHGQNLLASILHENGDLDGAAEILEEVVRLFIKVWGPKGRSVAKAKVDLAAVLFDQGKLSNAVTLYTEAAEIYKDVLGDSHTLTVEAKSKLARCKREMGGTS